MKEEKAKSFIEWYLEKEQVRNTDFDSLLRHRIAFHVERFGNGNITHNHKEYPEDCTLCVLGELIPEYNKYCIEQEDEPF